MKLKNPLTAPYLVIDGNTGKVTEARDFASPKDAQAAITQAEKDFKPVKIRRIGD